MIPIVLDTAIASAQASGAAGVQHTRSTCPYCGVGCGVIIESQGSQITGVRGDPAHPANFGRLCSKGQTLHLTAAPHVQAQMRALTPLRRAARGGPLHAVAWESALAEVAQRLARTIEQHGPDSVGLYLSGQLLTEDYYVFNKLAKGLIGTNNVDTNSRLCMSSAVAGYKASLGADSVPACYEDLDHAATVFITGSNMAWAHPVLYRRLEAARAANPQMKVVVVDPRRTETAAEADLFLQIQPGTDVMLHHALLHVMLWEGWVDAAYIAAHTSGFAALRESVRACTPEHAAQVCGLQVQDIITAARWFAGVGQGDGKRAGDPAANEQSSARSPTLSLWCQGLNQSSSGTDKNTSLLNLHLATGQIGKPGAGPLSLTGQPNAMGGREVGGLANLLSAHRNLANPTHRAEVAALWGVKSVPAEPGLAAVEMFQAAADGKLRALWIACTNPAQSLPDQNLVRAALERCEFVVLQEAYLHTATVPYADVILPAATWGEKEGTVTNSERRISRVRPAVPSAGQARADWRIAAGVAQRLEALLPERYATQVVNAASTPTLFPYSSAAQVWAEHRETTRGTDIDITGLSLELLDQPQQWPRPAPTGGDASSTPPSPRLYTTGHFPTPDGRARFVVSAPRPTAEVCDTHYPVALTTGRLRDQWHGMSRTGLLGRLFAHGGGPSVDMHPQELGQRGWLEGDLIQVRSRHGELLLPVRATESVGMAQAHIAMHWGQEWLGGSIGLGVNVLMPSARCPQSKQPELKHAAVHVQRVLLPWSLAAAAWLPAAEALAVRERLRPWLALFPYASCTLFGQEPGAQTGLLLRAAAATPAQVAVVDAIQTLFGLGDTAQRVVRYTDPGISRRRLMALAPDGSLAAYLLAGTANAAGWMQDWLQARQGNAATSPLNSQLSSQLSRALLTDAFLPPSGSAPPRGALVCTCNAVSQAAIEVALLTQAPVDGSVAEVAACAERLKAQLGCGSTCGSCVPAVKQLVRACAASQQQRVLG